MAETKAEKLRELIHQVFNTSDGKELIALLVDEFLFKNALNQDTNMTYANLGKQQLILELWQASQMSTEDIRKIVEQYNKGEVL